MKKLLLLALLGLSFAAKAQCFTAQLDTSKLIQFRAPYNLADTGYIQPVTFLVRLADCPWQGFEQSEDQDIYVPNVVVQGGTLYVYGYVENQVEVWIRNNFK